MDPNDPFAQLIAILCNVRADWEIKTMTLSEIGKLLDVTSDSTLPAKVAECISNLDELRRTETEVCRLQEEVDNLKAKISTFKEDMVATREMADEMKKVAEWVTAIFGETEMAAAKAKLFDEGVLRDSKLSGTRIVRILNDFVEQVEVLMVGMKESANWIEKCSRKLTGSVISREIHLSDISLPNSFPIGVEQGTGKDHTPQSKKSQQKSARHRPIELDSSLGSDVPDLAKRERNWNLTEIFNQMNLEAVEPAEEAVPMEVGHPM